MTVSMDDDMDHDSVSMDDDMDHDSTIPLHNCNKNLKPYDFVNKNDYA